MSKQAGWRWCHKCQGAFYAGGPSQGACPADHQAHDGSTSGHYALVLGDDAQGQQGGWRWCRKCQGMFYAGAQIQGVCPVDHRTHDASASAKYAAVLGDVHGQAGWRWCRRCEGMYYAGGSTQGACPAAAGQQAGWRWCRKCQGMFYGGGSTLGVCPLDHRAHDGSMSAHYAVIKGDDAQGQQGGWRWCQKCQSMFYAGSDGPVRGVCPVGLAHDGRNSAHYAIVGGDGAQGQQGGWRWCQKCQSMFYAGSGTRGVCPVDPKGHDGSASGHYAAVLGDAGVVHDGSASASYAMPWDLPETLHIHDNLTFAAGVAVGGWFDLVLNSKGNISFSGHFHDSGLDSYDMTSVVVLMSPDGSAYSIANQGRTHGTLESGSRDHDWVTNEHSNLVATQWDQFAQASWVARADASSLIGKALTDFIASIAKDLANELGKAATAAVISLV